MDGWGWKVWVTFVIASIASACDAPEQNFVGTAHQALTSDQGRVLEFEAPSADWSTTNGSTIAASPDAYAGARAMEILINGYTQVASVTISAPGSARSQASIRVKFSQPRVTLGSSGSLALLADWGASRMSLAAGTKIHAHVISASG